MIRKIKEVELPVLKNSLANDCFHNPYFYIDINMFGYSCDKIDTFVIQDNEKVYGYIYKYFNSVQLFIYDSYKCFEELGDFILKLNVVMISGNASVIKKLSEKLDDKYNSSYGVIMSYDGEKNTSTGKLPVATQYECREIAQLICSDDDIGGHYEIDNLEKQLIERMTLYNCKNVYMTIDEKIVAHAATYADDGNLAIIGGVITLKDYRGTGLGKKVVNYLTDMLLEEKKTPILYCYNHQTVKWYEKMNWKTVNECGKLVFRKGDM